MLIVDAEVDGRPGMRVQVGERIEAVGDDLDAEPGEDVFDARGGAVIAGLHDHHAHLRAILAARTSVRLDMLPSAGSRSDVRDLLRAAHDRAAPGEWLRAVGFHAPRMGPLDRDLLDEMVRDRPVRVLHRTGEMWVLNSSALDAIDAAREDEPGIERDPTGRPTGRLWRMDAWLGTRVGRSAPGDDAWRTFSRDALAMGVTGYTDATPGRGQDDIAAFADLVRRDVVRQRLVLMSPPGRAPEAGVGLGPYKIVLDDTALPDGEELADDIARAHRAGVPVAVHCVTLDQLSVALDALNRAGSRAGDRIEHAGVVAPAMIHSMHELGVTVVTQPGFVRERGDDYLRDVAGAERDWLYPCGSLMRAGVPVAAGTDAPHSDLDVWRAIAAAADRRTASGVVLRADERIPARVALALFQGRPEEPGRARAVRVGEPGDLCLLRAPLEEVLADPSREAVAGAVVGGRPALDG